MKKRKAAKPNNKRMHIQVQWEIIQAAEFATKNYPNNAPIPSRELLKIYRGNGVACILDGVIDAKQRWGVTIVTRVKDDNGVIYPVPHEVSWRIDEPMNFNDFIKGNPKIKVNRGNGLKTRWQGVADEWLKMVDEELAGLIAVDAWATANCLAEIKANGVKPKLLDQYFKMLAVKDQHCSIYGDVQEGAKCA